MFTSDMLPSYMVVSTYPLPMCYPSLIYTPPKFNSEFTPEKWCLQGDPFILGFCNFSGAFAVKLREVSDFRSI